MARVAVLHSASRGFESLREYNIGHHGEAPSLGGYCFKRLATNWTFEAYLQDALSINISVIQWQNGRFINCSSLVRSEPLILGGQREFIKINVGTTQNVVSLVTRLNFSLSTWMNSIQMEGEENVICPDTWICGETVYALR